MNKDAKASLGIAETPGDFLGGKSIDEEGTQGFVLPMGGIGRFQEEASVVCYLI